jgi:hypothetical protein
MESLLVALEALEVVCRVYWKAQPLSINSQAHISPTIGHLDKYDLDGYTRDR